MNYGMDYQGGGGDAYNSGGGFTSGGGDAYGQQSSQGGGGGGGGRRNYDEQRMIPVTCCMIKSASLSLDDGQEVVLEDGRKLAHAKLVGAVRSFEQNSTNVTYMIEDGTGLVEVKQWLDETGCTAQQQLMEMTLKEHQYVKIIAKLKPFDQQVQVVADSVRPLATGNELTHHFLDVVYSAEMSKQRESIVQPASPMMGVTSTTGGVGFGSGGSSRTPLMAQGGGDGLRDIVVSYVQENGAHSDVGAHIPACIKHFGSQYSEAQIRSVMDELQAEGMVYTTVDEDHVKAAM